MAHLIQVDNKKSIYPKKSLMALKVRIMSAISYIRLGVFFYMALAKDGVVF